MGNAPAASSLPRIAGIQLSFTILSGAIVQTHYTQLLFSSSWILLSISIMSAPSPHHSYYPVDAYIAGYSPNEASVPTLLTVASVASAALLSATLALVSYARPGLLKADRLAILWFVLCTLTSFLDLLC